MACHSDNLGLLISLNIKSLSKMLPRSSGELNAVHLRHVKIGEYQHVRHLIRVGGNKLLEGLFPVDAEFDSIACVNP